MSGTIDTNLHRDEPDTIKMPTQTTFGDWLAVLRQYGFVTALAAVLLWYMAVHVVAPMRSDQQRFMDSVIQTNILNATTAAKQTEIQQTQARALQDIVPVLQQIRDDQRRGAWNDTTRPKAVAGEP
jgi:hypothetical protein